MDLNDSPTEAAFRSELRSWLQDNIPTDPEPRELAERWEYMKSFQRRLYDGGWVALSYPKEYGGRGLGPLEEAILSQELALANAPAMLPLGHLGRPFLTHATEEQRKRYLPALLSLEEVWCQGFSEPQAGSDLANIRTKAEFDGEGGYRITGQKVWTSYGVFADYCLLLARTDPESERHRGISAFMLPLNSDGVTVRPIVLANGDEEFAEVFLDDVYVPTELMLGEPGAGWAIAMETIAHERGAVDTGYLPKFETFLDQLLQELLASGDELNVRTLHNIGEVTASLDVLGMHTLRHLSDVASGQDLGFESSIDKMLMTQVEQRLMEVALDSLNNYHSNVSSEWFDRYLYARSASIYGGSAQIQRNILAQRVLGLPR